MYILEKRLDVAYAIKVVDEIGISMDKLKWWLHPFFMISNNLEGEVLLATVVVTQNDDIPFFYRELSTFYIDGKTNEDSVYYNILYVARAVFKNLATQFGYANVHAGCISCDNIGILIKAKRNQGKTTLILHSLISKNFQLIANDQVMLNGTSIKALGYPAVIGIRNNSCTDMFQNKLIEKALWMSKDPYQKNEKPIVHISDLSSIFGCHVKSEVAIGLVLEYEKSTLDDELQISPLTCYEGDFTEISYPLSEIYGKDISNASLDCLLQARLNLKSQTIKAFDTEIQLLKVRCGINRIDDLLQEIQYIIVHRRKNEWMGQIK